MYTSKPLSGQKGMALALTLLFLLILVMGGSLFFIASQTEIKHGSSYTRRMEALSVAESAAERALWKLQSADWFTTYSQNTWNTNFVGDTDHPIRIAPGQYMRVSYPETIFSGTDYANLKIIATGILGREEGGKVIPISTKKIEMIVRVEKDNNMPLVFDYAYFINNWGWWYYAGGERCRGCMRSNGRFDVRSIYNNPSRRMTIDGSVEAQYAVDYHNYSPDGLAGLRSNPPNYETEPYRRPSLEKENIPNLQDMDYYGSISTGWNPDTNEYNDHPAGTIRIGTRTFTDDGIFGDDESYENLILIGTAQNPIEITDNVVILGNLIIKGSVSVTGSNPEYPRYGSIYVGKNVYIAGDIQYVNGPNWSAYPQWQQSAGTDYKNPASSTFNIANNDDGLPSKSGTSIMDTWVNNNTTTTLLSVSAKGGLVYGNYSTAVDHNSNYNNWVSNEYLFTMGSEDVGADGIPDTHDAGEGDNIPQLATEDLDGDGSVRMTDYNWKDVTTTGGNNYHSNPLNGFDGLRRDGGSTGPLWDPQKGDTINQYGETATNNINLIDGVYYTQHFLAGRVANSPRFRGSLISKDEAIVYSGTLNLIQDTRYHSNYRANPNFPIYLFPPGSVFTGGGALGKLQRVLSWKEIR